MRIVVPKVRTDERWSKRRAEIEKIIIDPPGKLTFQNYCRLSLIFVEATNQVILSSESKNIREYLLAEDASFVELTKDPAETEQGKKILGVLRYAWKNIFELLEGWRRQQTEKANDPLGIYKDESINMQFARLEDMLRELQSKGFRTHDFMKENQYITESNEKEMREELVFIKLLKNILTNQIQKINMARNLPPEEEESSDEGGFDISQVIDASRYFERKKQKESSHQPQDPISRQEENRIFNRQVLKYIQSVQRRN